MLNHMICVIPTFNCEPQIKNTLAKAILKGSCFQEIWVIDNRSFDKTLEEVLKFRKQNTDGCKIKVFRNAENVSLGGTLKVAFKMADERGFSYVAILHGDDQANPEDLRIPFSLINESGADISYFGSRFMKGAKLSGYRTERILGNLLLNTLYSIRHRRILSDLGSGLNLYNVNQLRNIDFESMTNSLVFNYELLLEFIRRKQDFKYFPICWVETGQISNANNIKVFFQGLSILLGSNLAPAISKLRHMPVPPEEII